MTDAPKPVGRPKGRKPTQVVHLRVPVDVYDAHARASIREGETLHARLVRALAFTARRLPPAPV